MGTAQYDAVALRYHPLLDAIFTLPVDTVEEDGHIDFRCFNRSAAECQRKGPLAPPRILESYYYFIPYSFILLNREG